VVLDALDRLADDGESTRRLAIALPKRALAVRSVHPQRSIYEDPGPFTK
jgi:hypothetical protein